MGERRMKSEARRKALGIKTKQEYAAYLAKQALKFGELARDDARKAAKMEDAIVTGGHIPHEVQELVMDGHGKVKATALSAARTAAVEANVDLATSEDFNNFVNHKKAWKKHYKKIFNKKMSALKGH